MCPSAGNKQTLRYSLVASQRSAEVFPHLRWAGYLTDWAGPDPSQRPSAYIIIWHDSSRGSLSEVDLGIVAQSINLACNDVGLRTCMIGAFDLAAISALFSPSEPLSPQLVIAIGAPAETISLEPLTTDVRYYRTPDGVHHVPKRSLSDLIV